MQLKLLITTGILLIKPNFLTTMLLRNKKKKSAPLSELVAQHFEGLLFEECIALVTSSTVLQLHVNNTAVQPDCSSACQTSLPEHKVSAV